MSTATVAPNAMYAAMYVRQEQLFQYKRKNAQPYRQVMRYGCLTGVSQRLKECIAAIAQDIALQER